MQVSQTVAASLAPCGPTWPFTLSKANRFFLTKTASLKEPVELHFFLEETEFHPAFRKHLLSPTGQVLLLLSGQWLGEPNPLWLTGQAFVPTPLIRLSGESVSQVSPGMHTIGAVSGTGQILTTRPNQISHEVQSQPRLPLQQNRK